MHNILPFLVSVPFIGALCVFLLRKIQPALAKAVGMVTAFAVFIAILGLIGQATTSGLPEGNEQNGLLFAPEWLQLDLPITLIGHPVEWQLQLGMDGISWLLVALTALITLAVCALVIKHISEGTNEYLSLLLVSEGCLMGVFTARDMLSFYIFFEAVLIPLLVMIHQYGEAGRAAAAAKKFLLFTLFGSFPLLIGLVLLIVQTATSDRGTTISLVSLQSYESSVSVLACWLILFGFGVKMAILPLHSWLPTTYTTSHPTTTALLAAVVSKMGTYGILRILLPSLPASQIETFQIVLGSLGIAAILYGAAVALSQVELRGMLAYSSVSHMGFIVIGMAAMNDEGLSGAAIQMLNHGLIIGGLFLATAMWEVRGGPVRFDESAAGRAVHSPVLASLFVLLILAGTGLPGLNSFAGELLTLSGMFKVCSWATGIASLGLIFGAWYSLRCLQRMLFATPASHDSSHGSAHGSSHGSAHGSTHGQVKTVRGLSLGESVALVPIAALCVILGIMPQRAVNAVSGEMHQIAVNANAEQPAVTTQSAVIRRTNLAP